MWHRTLPFAFALSWDACIFAPPAPPAPHAVPPPPPPCEHLPTDLAAAKRPLPESVSWSADGAWIAAAMSQTGEISSHVAGAEGIVVWSAKDGVVRKRYRIEVQSVAFAHTGERLAFASVAESGVIDLRTDCAVRWPRRGHLVAWRSDDRLLYVAGFGGVAAIDALRGTPIHEWTVPAGDRDRTVVSLGVARDVVAFGDRLHVVRTADVDLARVDTLPSTANAIGNAQAIAIAPDGSAVASAVVEEIPVRQPPNAMPGPPNDYRFSVHILSLPEGRERAIFPGDPEALAFSPDSGSLAIALGTHFSVRDLATGSVRVLDVNVVEPRSVTWSPDGALVALADWRGAVRIYDAGSPGAPRVLRP